MIQSTVTLLLRDSGRREVLLGLKKHGFGAGKYAGFGGKIEPGETAHAAAVREIGEEAGVQVDEESLQHAGRLVFLFPAKPEWNITIEVFIAREWQGDPRESGEMKPAWFAVEDIPYGQMWDDARYWLPRVLDGQRIMAEFTYGEDNETVTYAEITERPCDDPTTS